MFHMMEHQARARDALEGWLLATPIFSISARASRTPLTPERWASELVGKLVDDGWLLAQGAQLQLATAG
jgi:hypothetical protein